MKKPLTPAVAYFRMSDDDQTVSIPRQRHHVAQLAETHGYRVIRDYVDEGKSGSKETEKRIGFQGLLLDSEKGDFKAILCYNASRFARLDSIDGAFAKKILRSNEVYLHTVNEGIIDWRTPQGRMADFMLSEQANAYSISLSKDSISGRVRVLNEGCWPHGAVPYGYDRLYSYDGQQTLIRRTQRFRKPRNWKLKLVVNEAEAAIVRRIYDEFVNKAQSMRAIALALNAEKVPPPDNLPRKQKLGWTNITVAGILRHKAYIGVAVMGKGRKTKKVAFHRLDPMEKDGACPVIIEGTDLWESAQQMLDRNKERKARQQSGRCSYLSGFLFCQHCGYALNKEQRGDGPVRYVCRSNARTPSGCHQWFVDEAELLPLITRRVVGEVDAELLKALDGPDNVALDADRFTLLEQHAEALRKRYQRAKERYLSEDDADLAVELKADVKRLKLELQEAEDSVRKAQAVESQDGAHNFADWWSSHKDEVLLAVTERYETEVGEATRVNFPNVDREVIENCPTLYGAKKVPLDIETRAFNRDRLRALLNRLGVTVAVRWERSQAQTVKGGNRRWIADRARLEIDLKWPHAARSSNREVEGSTGTR